MNTPVKFELAKLLKEKGFDELCNNYYSQALFEGTNPDWEGVFPKYSIFKHSDYHYNSKPNNNDLWFECSAPTIAEVVMWLYEKHWIWIQVKPGGKLETWDFITQKKDNTFAVPYFEIKQHKPFFNSPTEAYEAAIEYTLKDLI